MLTTQHALQRMKADIQLRGLSKSTLRTYPRMTEIFLEQSGRSIGDLDETDVRRFLGKMIVEKKHSAATVNAYSAAIRFFFAVTLNRTMNYLQIPRMKIPKTLPDVLTRDEVSELIAQCSNSKHRAMLLTAYGSGLRVSELVKLKTSDIDSASMRVFVRGGKGQKDRFTILSDSALNSLRDYWRRYRPKSPDGYLFPGSKNVGHLCADAVAKAIENAHGRTSIGKNITPHTLRHCFATHLLEDGYSLFQIKEMLGHSSLSSTTVYLHLANTTFGITSPADKLPEKFEDYPGFMANSKRTICVCDQPL